jgi:hypothetical protein
MICLFLGQFLPLSYLLLYESLTVILLDLKFSFLREVSACPRDPKAVLFRIVKILLEALDIWARTR